MAIQAEILKVLSEIVYHPNETLSRSSLKPITSSFSMNVLFQLMFSLKWKTKYKSEKYLQKTARKVDYESLKCPINDISMMIANWSKEVSKWPSLFLPET